MTKNADGDSISSRIARLVVEFEQSRDPESTEIGRQFAVRNKIRILLFIFHCFSIAITTNYD
jgi:hypothetical protein